MRAAEGEDKQGCEAASGEQGEASGWVIPQAPHGEGSRGSSLPEGWEARLWSDSGGRSRRAGGEKGLCKSVHHLTALLLRNTASGLLKEGLRGKSKEWNSSRTFLVGAASTPSTWSAAAAQPKRLLQAARGGPAKPVLPLRLLFCEGSLMGYSVRTWQDVHVNPASLATCVLHLKRGIHPPNYVSRFRPSPVHHALGGASEALPLSSLTRARYGCGSLRFYYVWGASLATG